MRFIFIRNFTTEQEEKLNTFLELCRMHDGVLPMLNLPDEPFPCDGCIAAVLEGSGEFAGILTFLQTEDDFELAALVHPQYRRQGIFTALYREFEKSILGETSSTTTAIFWPTKSNVSAEADFLAHIGKREAYHDLLMTLDLSAYYYVDEDIPFTFFSARYDKKEAAYIYHIYKGLRRIGTCYVSDGCIHHVEIHPAYRRNGFGSKLLMHVLRHQKKKGFKHLFLHVTSRNNAAYRLYTKLGFQIAEQVVYFQ